MTPIEPIGPNSPVEANEDEGGSNGGFSLTDPTAILGLFVSPTFAIARFAGLAGFQDVDNEIRIAEKRSKTLTGPALTENMVRLGRLRHIKGMTENLDEMEIRRPDVDRLRDEASRKLKAGMERPPRLDDYKEGVELYKALERYERLEKKREEIRRKVEGLYPVSPWDDKVAFRLDFDGVKDEDLDPWTEPSAERLRNLPVVQAYSYIRFSEKEGDVRMKENVDKLFQHFKVENVAYDNGVSGPREDPIAFVNGLSDDLGALVDGQALEDVSTFLSMVSLTERLQTRQGGDEDSLTLMFTADSLKMNARFPGVITVLSDFDKFVAKKIPPIPAEEQLKEMKEMCGDMMKGCERYRKAFGPNGLVDGQEKALQEVHNGLDALDPKSETFESDLKGAADKMAPAAKVFQIMEEKTLRVFLGRAIDTAETIPSSAGDLASIRKDLEAVTDTEPSDPAKRQEIYASVFQRTGDAAALRLADARIRSLPLQKEAASRAGITVHGVFAGMTGASYDSYRFGEKQTEIACGQFDRLRGEYEKAKTLLESSDPSKRFEGRRLLSRLEGLPKRGELAEWAEHSQTINQVSGFVVSFSIIALSSLGAEAGGAFVLAETNSLLAGTSLAIYADIAPTLSFLVSSGLFTAISRSLTQIVTGDEGKTDFFEDWGKNMAMMGMVGGMLKGVGKLADAGLDFLAMRNLAARGLVAEGAAVSALDDSGKALLATEKARVMEGVVAKWGTRFALLGTEYTGLMAFEYLGAVAQLSEKGDPDPEGNALKALSDPKVQGQAIGMMLGLKALNASAAPSREEDICDPSLKADYQVRQAKLDSDLAAFRKDWEEGRVTSYEDLTARAKDLLNQRQTLLWDISSQIPQGDFARGRMAAEFDANQSLLSSLDGARSFVKAANSVMENSAFGVHAGEGEGYFEYKVDAQSDFVRSLKDAAAKGGGSVNVYPNGMIEFSYRLPLAADEQTTVFIPESAPRLPAPATVH